MLKIGAYRLHIHAVHNHVAGFLVITVESVTSLTGCLWQINVDLKKSIGQRRDLTRIGNFYVQFSYGGILYIAVDVSGAL